MEKRPLVSIIIVSFNTKKLLSECIASIDKFMKSSFEIIVVDNNSADGSPEYVNKLRRKDILLISNTQNVGFAKANNQAIKKAKGKYILLLNSDTYLTEDCVSACIQKLEEDENIGVISCKLKNKDGSIQPTGGYFPTPLRIFLWMSFLDDLPLVGSLIKPFHPKKEYYTKDMELDWVTGAFFMFPIEITKKVGMLDEDYFMYVEEVDFCYRAKSLGKKVQYLNSASLVHLGQASSTNEFAITSEFKNILLFYRKHMSFWSGFVKITLKMGAALRVFIFGILGKAQQRKIYEKITYSI